MCFVKFLKVKLLTCNSIPQLIKIKQHSVQKTFKVYQMPTASFSISGSEKGKVKNLKVGV